jgi:hypothetical protein
MKKYYKYGTKINTAVNDMNREVDTLLFFKDLYVNEELIEEARVILHSEIIPPSAIAEISAYCTTTWEDSCPKEIKKKCSNKEIEYATE